MDPFQERDLVSRYAWTRISYPPDLKDAVVNFLTEDERNKQLPFDQLVDVGCGSGQSTPLFADHFQTLIGVDCSQAQIEEAKRRNVHENIEYKLGEGTTLPVADDSTTLVTVASSLLCFDIPTFYEEVRRILKPGGVLAIWGYNWPLFDCDGFPNESEAVNRFVDEVFTNKEQHLGSWLTTCEKQYAELEPCFENERRFYSLLNGQRTIDEYLHFISCSEDFCQFQANIPNVDCMDYFRQRILDIFRNPKITGETTMNIKSTVFMLMSRKC
ncbi:putative methyltransferase DDB_G0268948 isoform X2 [Tubulanus polymorphus]